jgi:hypothetical protein
VVEGGTLLRCYTSQRGIEGSNPSSSASRVTHLQHKRESKDKGRNYFRPLLHQQVHQRRQKAHIRGHKRHIRNRESISTATRSCGRLRGASRPHSIENGLEVSSYTGFWMRLSENSPSKTFVKKGKRKGRNCYTPALSATFVCLL